VSSAFSFLLLLLGSSLLRICQSFSNERLCLNGTGVIRICQSCWYHYVRSFDPVRYFLLSFKICQYLAGKRMISTSKVDDTSDTDGWTHHTLVSLLSFISSTTQIPERSECLYNDEQHVCAQYLSSKRARTIALHTSTMAACH
jgi:hypothetical protein